ncbi:hypothetical protein H4V95_001180 [Arthrobacter sp. CAN_C5]|nr:hypothetical protein [Arthrobacter sp. CAN_C5]
MTSSHSKAVRPRTKLKELSRWFRLFEETLSHGRRLTLELNHPMRALARAAYWALWTVTLFGMLLDFVLSFLVYFSGLEIPPDVLELSYWVWQSGAVICGSCFFLYGILWTRQPLPPPHRPRGPKL